PRHDPGKVVLRQPVRRDDVRVFRRPDGGELVLLVGYLPDLRDRIVLLLGQEVPDRRLDRLVVLREPAVVERAQESADEVGAHDERLVAVLGVRRQERVEVRDVEPDPLALLVRLVARRLGVPPDELLLLAPWLAGQVGRRSVVEDAPVRGPREPPAMPEIVLVVSRLARV